MGVQPCSSMLDRTRFSDLHSYHWNALHPQNLCNPNLSYSYILCQKTYQTLYFIRFTVKDSPKRFIQKTEMDNPYAWLTWVHFFTHTSMNGWYISMGNMFMVWYCAFNRISGNSLLFSLPALPTVPELAVYLPMWTSNLITKLSHHCFPSRFYHQHSWYSILWYLNHQHGSKYLV